MMMIKIKKEIDLDELQHRTRRLLDLLKDQQPGMSMWDIILKTHIEKMVEILTEETTTDKDTHQTTQDDDASSGTTVDWWCVYRVHSNDDPFLVAVPGNVPEDINIALPKLKDATNPHGLRHLWHWSGVEYVGCVPIRK